MHLMGRRGIKDSLKMNNGDYAVVEGAMGYFDGIYNTFENSSYDISRALDIPAILVYKPEGEMFSAIPKIKGMVDFSGSNIKGIILNKTTENVYNMMKEIIEKHIDAKVLGYLPNDVTLEIESRYLGLMQTYEKTDCNQLISRAAEAIEKTVDLDAILEMMNKLDILSYEYGEKRDINIAIAYDDAFNFYYNENLKLLENICNVKYFSPLRDKRIPDSELIIIGGGYPELYAKELSDNLGMIASIKENVELGKYIIAEGGGFMYLTSYIEEYPMSNIFHGKATMTNKLQRFGYVDMTLNKDTILGEKGTKISGNEYHRSVIETKNSPVFDIKKPKVERYWQCGYAYKNVLAYYQHINFLGNMKNLNYLLDTIERIKGER